jgi:hypothetical protein
MSFGCYSNSIYYNNIKIQNKKITEFYSYGFVNKSQRDYTSEDKHYKYNDSKKITEYFTKK